MKPIIALTIFAVMVTTSVCAAPSKRHRSHTASPAGAVGRGSDPVAGGHDQRLLYGVGNGGQPFRTTTTGGNAGGYSNKN